MNQIANAGRTQIPKIVMNDPVRPNRIPPSTIAMRVFGPDNGHPLTCAVPAYDPMIAAMVQITTDSKEIRT